jgi:hypothetical protein
VRFTTPEINQAVRRSASALVVFATICPLLLSASDQRWTSRQVQAARASGPTLQITPPGSFDQSTCKHTQGITAFRYPEEGPGWPGYGAFGELLPNDGVWAGLVFFTATSCVRPDFNLLDFFDVPAVLNCPMNITGVNFSMRGADFPFEIKITLLEGTTTPIYFVLWTELQAATADGVLTIGELSALPSLRIGFADKLEYHILNSNAPCGDGNGHEYFKASGYLQDGRKFHFNYEEIFFPSQNLHVFQKIKIEFTPPDR